MSRHFEIKRAQRPDRAAGHAAVAGHDGHDAVLDHEAGQGRQLVGELFFAPFWIRTAGKSSSPLVTVLAAEGVELVGDAADNAFDAFLAFGGGDGGDGDEGFALHVGVGDGPFVVFVDRVEEGSLRYCASEDLVADARAGHYKVSQGSAGWGIES